jgi:biotin synthase-like enzyme
MKNQTNISTMEITTVIGCKIRCAYCPQSKLMKKYAEKSNIYKMTFDTFKSCLDKIRSMFKLIFREWGNHG